MNTANQQQLTAAVLKLPEALRQMMATPLNANDIKQEPARGDGFSPRTVDAMAMLRILDNTFDWTLTVRQAFIDHHALIAVATVSLGWKYWVTSPSGQDHLVETHRDGVGAVRMTTGQNGYVDADFSLKQAVTDAIKLAGKHAGFFRELWGRGATVMTPAAQMAQQSPVQTGDAATLPAQRFQIETIINYFEREVGVDRTSWTGNLQIAVPEQISYGLAQQILSGQHPYVQAIIQQTGKRPGGIKASAAR